MWPEYRCPLPEQLRTIRPADSAAAAAEETRIRRSFYGVPLEEFNSIGTEELNSQRLIARRISHFSERQPRNLRGVDIVDSRTFPSPEKARGLRAPKNIYKLLSFIQKVSK